MKDREKKDFSDVLCVTKIENLYFLCEKDEIQSYDDGDLTYSVIAYNESYEKCIEEGIRNIYSYAQRMQNIIEDFCEKWSGDRYPSREMELKYLHPDYKNKSKDGIIYRINESKFYMILGEK